MKARGRLALLLLAFAGCASVPGLVGRLEDGTVAERRHAARRLGIIGVRASGAEPALIRALRDDDTEVRVLSAIALSSVGPCSPEAASALQSATSDPDDLVRAMAAQSLGIVLFHARAGRIDRACGRKEEWRLLFSPLLGEAARGPVEALTRALADRSASVRRAAASSLGFLGPDAREAVPALVRTARGDASVYVRMAAAFALAMQGPDSADAVATLGEIAREDPSAELREYASAMLKEIGEGRG